MIDKQGRKKKKKKKNAIVKVENKKNNVVICVTCWNERKETDLHTDISKKESETH